MTGSGRVPGDWNDWLANRLDAIRSAGQWRAYRDFDARGPGGVLSATGQKVVSFASNDYLGLTAHPAVIDAAHQALDRWGAGTGGSRLITGARPVHRQLENELAAWRGTDRAVLFPTGFAANLGVLSTLGGAGVRIISDSLNHASIIDGTRLARAEVMVWPHRDLVALEELVASAPGPTLVVADTVFSMDGDALDVAAVAAVCRRHGSLLVLDEAHAVLGPDPTPGDVAGVEVIRVGTLSKTLGALGGFVACSESVADLLVNAARSSIFTTALTPADAAAALAALRIVRSPEGDRLRAVLRGHVDRLAPGHPSPIVPVVLGDEARAVAAATALLQSGLLVPAIRPPTVAPGSSRLRVTFSAAHTEAEVDHLLSALATLEQPQASDSGGERDAVRRFGSPTTARPSGERPAKVVLVIGTATEVGKTWVGAATLRALRDGGATVAARKPAQSFDPADPHPTDAEVLAAATGETPTQVCPAHRSYTVAMAPPMATDVLGLAAPRLADLLAELTWPDEIPDIGWVETVGGPRSPIAVDGDAVDLAAALGPDRVVLVADAGLGTINSVLLSIAPFARFEPVVILNRYDASDDLHRRNYEWLKTREGLEVVTDPEALAHALFH
ncbi:MAG: aminotransferase class I/II-fold pyridoxal phosphate-dependent enzyme [Aquihabitans sp.]